MWRPPRRLAAFCLSAFLSVGCTAGDGPADTPAPGSPHTGTIVALRAEQPSAWDPAGRNWAVTLTWATTPGSAADRFVILRDGVPLQQDLPRSTYRDLNVDPGVTYAYAVLGTGPRGGTTPPALVRIRTHAPSLAQARLDGSFLVDLRATSSSGLSAPAPPGPLLFRYTPRCRGRTCPALWSVRARATQGVLDRSGASYRGVARGPFMIRSCNAGAIVGRLVVTTRVVAAGPVERSWLATRIEGTVLETGRVPGCTPARIRWRFAGVIQT